MCCANIIFINLKNELMKRMKNFAFSNLVVLMLLMLLQSKVINAQYIVRTLDDTEVKRIGFFNNKIEPVSTELDYVDSDYLYLQKRKLREAGEQVDFVYEHDVNIDLKASNSFNRGLKADTWKTKIFSEGASAISVEFDDFFIPEGGRLYIYSDNGKIVQGPITSRLNSDAFSNVPVPGESITLEYEEPSNIRQRGKLTINKVYHNYDRDQYDDNYKQDGTCLDGWCVQKRAVCKITTSNGSAVCTGTMLNNVEEDFTPYILTAKHCFGPAGTQQSPSVIKFVFNYIRPNCSTGSSDDYKIVYDGAEFISKSPRATCAENWVNIDSVDTDFYMLKLLNYDDENNFDRLAGIHFAGWTRDYDSSNSPDSTVSLHHGYGWHMMATESFNPPGTHSGYRFSCFQYPAPSPWCYPYFQCDDGETVWRVDYDTGYTRGGSSGSALFDMNGLVIGDLSGPNGDNGVDYYGRFSRSWELVPGMPSRNLKEHLDPNNTNSQTVDAISPTIIYHNENIDDASRPLYNATHTMELAGNISDITYDGLGHFPDNNLPFDVGVDADVEFRAGGSVCILPGVTVNKGADFIAQIGSFDCADGLDYDFYQTGAGSTKTDHVSSNEKALENVSDFYLFPNPAKDQFSLEFQLENKDYVNIDIINIEGQLVKQIAESKLFAAGRQDIEILTDAIPAGTYLCRIQTSQSLKVSKLIIVE